MCHTVLQFFLDVSFSMAVGLNLYGLLLLQVYYNTESMKKLLIQIFFPKI